MPVPETPYGTRAPTPPGMLLLDRNEGTPPAADLWHHLPQDPDLLFRYPDAAALESAIARRLGVPDDSVLVTAGADDAIDRCCRAYLAPGRDLVTHTPTFEMLGRYAMLAGGTIRDVTWTRGAFPIDNLAAIITDRTGLVALVSPNNPTGGSIPLDTLRAILHLSGSRPVMLDHAYVEYGTADATTLTAEFDQLIVIRTMSKAWGLAGCRVGYAVASSGIIRHLRAAGAPYPVAAPSILLAGARIQADEAMTRHVDTVRRHRTRLETLFADLEVSTIPSDANFLLAEFGGRARFVHRGLAGLGVLVRDFTSTPGLDGALRVSIPEDPGDLERLERALRTVLLPEALLFDMDGVLVDVTESYRQCIIETAARFGVTLNSADVADAKLAGDASNDWIVTQRLLERRGVSVSLDRIVEVFQGLYLGADGTGGWRERERALVSPDRLRRWRSRWACAVVTGRPRAEAEWAVARCGFDAAIDAVVAMEDGPAKPAAEPVESALRHLGARRAWMIGDTPDDITAALRAGVVPIGVAPGGNDAQRDRLEAAGAALVLTDITQLDTWLP